MATKVFGMWNFSFSFSVCVCVTHVWVFLVSKAYFVLFSFYHSLWENWVYSTHCWLSPQHLLPSLLPNRAWFSFGDLGFQGCWLKPSSIYCHYSAGKALMSPFLIQSKKPKSSHWDTRLDAVWPCYPASSLTASPPPLCSFTWPLALP